MRKSIQLIAVVLLAQASLICESSEAMPVGAPRSSVEQSNSFIQKTAVVVRRGAAVGRRGGYAYRRTTVVRPGWHGGGVRWGGWARPGRYWWPVGGAIAAGAAIGVVSAATAAAWAGAAPGPGMCWYYTDASRTQGFWDACQ